MSKDTAPVFGLKEPDIEYVERPGAYALVFDSRGRVLVVNTPSGTHLPGGGANDGETPEQNLRRELLEECGARIRACSFITRATQYLHAIDEGHFVKRCDYFLVEIAAVGAPLEDDHEMLWIDPSKALDILGNTSHRFGLETALGRR